MKAGEWMKVEESMKVEEWMKIEQGMKVEEWIKSLTLNESWRVNER